MTKITIPGYDSKQAIRESVTGLHFQVQPDQLSVGKGSCPRQSLELGKRVPLVNRGEISINPSNGKHFRLIYGHVAALAFTSSATGLTISLPLNAEVSLQHHLTRRPVSTGPAPQLAVLTVRAPTGKAPATAQR
jgi:hypothetical protein